MTRRTAGELPICRKSVKSSHQLFGKANNKGVSLVTPLGRLAVFRQFLRVKYYKACATEKPVGADQSSDDGGPPERATWSARTFPGSKRRALASILSIVSSKSWS